jgi:hypothetical protein
MSKAICKERSQCVQGRIQGGEVLRRNCTRAKREIGGDGGQTTERISDDILGAFNEMESWVVLFEEKTPTEDALSGEESEPMSQVTMIGVHIDTSPEQHGPKLFESFDNA